MPDAKVDHAAGNAECISIRFDDYQAVPKDCVGRLFAKDSLKITECLTEEGFLAVE
jgi:hypothetical protein